MNLFISEWLMVPFYIERHLSSIFSISNLRFIIDLRGSFLSRFLYTKITILLIEATKLLGFLSPKIYFENPFFFILFPFWVLGILKLIKNKKFNLFLVLLGMAFLAYLINEKNLYFLFPIFTIYIYIAVIGLGLIKLKK